MNKIDKFEGEYEFLSNFWPCTISFQSQPYPSVEHAYQASKCVKIEDREPIRIAKSPAKAKQLGQEVEKHADWQERKRTVMFKFVLQKFQHNEELKAKLLETGDAELIEGNTWKDIYWGVYNGQGNNYLGQILMAVRDQLRRKSLYKRN